MSKSSRPSSRPQRPAAPPPHTQDNLQNFTIKAWTLTTQALQASPGLAVMDDLLGFFDWLSDQNVAAMRGDIPARACRPGCAFCCHVGGDRPDLLPPEAIRIAGFVQSRPVLLRQTLERLAQPEPSPRAACLFLSQARCLVYPVRPMRCRAQNSPDADLCRQYDEGRRDTMPLIGQPALLYQSLHIGLRLGLHQMDLPHEPLKMSAAMSLLLQSPDAASMWRQGQNPFALAAYPPATDEERLIAQFARQFKRRAQQDRTTMQAIADMFLTRPGAWARYTADGTAPL